MPETDSAPAADHGDLGLRAAVAYRVKARVAAICDPVIEANAARIRDTKGVRSTTAEMPLDSGDSVPIGTFTRNLSKASFFVEDARKVLDYADAQGETEYIVRPAFLKNLLKRLSYDARTRSVIDPITGEIVEGIGYDPGGATKSVSPHWDEAGVELLDNRLGFIDAALENLSKLTAADFSLPELEAGQ
ncbi:hypothetical protein ABZ352_18630 [Streptomyces griseofuscus]|uniref:hypothetical protein n=1 Tax=Streptomyces griseofuscus TaxID=146922 RepID=UPI0033C288EB